MKEIELTKNQVALVDDNWYDYLNQFKWCTLGRSGYYSAVRDVNRKHIHMHRVIMHAQQHQLVDHKDHNGCNNQVYNLRLCTPNQNQWNTKKTILSTSSQYKGVTWRKNRNKWQATIRFNTEKIYLGNYIYEQDAALAYDDMARQLFGEFAYVNFP